MGTFRKQTYNNITNAIGNTPLVKLSNLGEGLGAEVFGKIEFFNPSGSIKCRLGFAMLEAARASGKLKPGGVVIEPTSGNTGIGLAFACTALGYKLILTMPETMSIERRKLVKMLGADLVLTPGSEGMKGSIRKARELCAQIQDSYMPMQFDNPAGPAIHYQSTGPEIWEDTDGTVDIFVAGVGTG
ncbi:MAG: pyridoxal-phosphate dependent enzyme, partial [Turicibacter sp.]|nr:pyridoxal-phosphate dependent enzyme [Turicibacter sp.]